MHAYRTAHARDFVVIQTLEVALNAYTSRPLSPPPSPGLPDPEYIMDQIRDPLFEEMRSTVREYMSNARAHLIELMSEHNTGVYETMWQKLEPTLRILNKITERLDDGDVEGVNAIMKDTMMKDANAHQS